MRFPKDTATNPWAIAAASSVAVHPGNVKTDMNPSGENDPIDRAEKIMKITENWKEEFNGVFMRHDGKMYPL